MLNILTYPDPQLKQVSKPVTQFDRALHTLLDAMAETMYGANGVGLAAPQVGEFIRAFIVDIRGTRAAEEANDPMDNQFYEIINPRFSEGEGSIAFEEGCLSISGFTAEVKRKQKITLHYQDRHGTHQKVTAGGLLAVAFQHENDHLDGVLFVDHLSPLKRRLLKKKIAKSVTL